MKTALCFSIYSASMAWFSYVVKDGKQITGCMFSNEDASWLLRVMAYACAVEAALYGIKALL